MGRPRKGHHSTTQQTWRHKFSVQPKPQVLPIGTRTESITPVFKWWYYHLLVICLNAKYLPNSQGCLFVFFLFQRTENMSQRFFFQMSYFIEFRRHYLNVNMLSTFLLGLIRTYSYTYKSQIQSCLVCCLRTLLLSYLFQS